jgi:hypothetical protein
MEWQPGGADILACRICLVMNKGLVVAKYVAIAAFVATLFTTYYLRSEVLTLSKIRFSAEQVKAEEAQRERKISYPDRSAEYQAQMKHFEIKQEHYRKMLGLYQDNYDEYVKRIHDGYHPPDLPAKPQKPQSPQLSDELANINMEFKAQQYHYFDSTSQLNWVCCVSALLLVASLLFLIMFETGGQRMLYLAVLVLSFVFMIGPAFHSILSAVVGFLEAPRIF